jgi:hypothetical protein
LRLEAFHDTYGKLAMVPIIGSTFGLIDAFVYANQGTAYPQLNSVGIKNEPGKAAVSVLSSLPFPGVPGKGAAKAGEEIVEDAVKNNFNRFFNKIPANSKENISVELLEDGNYLFSATSPGKVPGSSALYQKWVDSAGKTVKYLKTTFDPTGKVIHIKSK